MRHLHGQPRRHILFPGGNRMTRDEADAVTEARTGVNIYPHGAYLWFLLGITLNKVRRFARPGEIELCFPRSVSLHPVFFDAADLLSVLLVEHRRYEDPENVMLNIRPRLGDSSPAQGRLAWIHRQQGKKPEARNEMATVIRAYPWSLWGWGQLIRLPDPIHATFGQSSDFARPAVSRFFRQL